MITYIKQLSLDTTLIALGNQLRAEIEHYKGHPTIQRLGVIKALLKDYKSLYRRFMKTDYPYNFLDDPSDLRAPFVFIDEIEMALRERYEDEEVVINLLEEIKGHKKIYYL